MVWVYFILLLITDICGVVLAGLTLPGLWLMLAGATLYAWLTHGIYLHYYWLIVMFVLALGAEIAELFLGGAGAKKAGASKWGIFGSLIGAIVGGIVLTPFPPHLISTVVGICLGSFVGAFVVELIKGQPVSQSMKIGWGAAKGRMTGIAGKVGIGLLVMALTFIAAFPISCSKPAPTMTTPPATLPTSS
jgi:uncharacterized protein YqgC (DUF456 family)